MTGSSPGREISQTIPPPRRKTSRIDEGSCPVCTVMLAMPMIPQDKCAAMIVKGRTNGIKLGLNFLEAIQPQNNDEKRGIRNDQPKNFHTRNPRTHPKMEAGSRCFPLSGVFDSTLLAKVPSSKGTDYALRSTPRKPSINTSITPESPDISEYGDASFGDISQG